MGLTIKREFLPVGQGAFYCERIYTAATEKITIVYDCGSISRNVNISNVISNNLERGETIDALFISHFHADHVNGIPILLKHCNVRRIFFPVISEQYKSILFTALKTKEPRSDIFTLSLIDDAVRTFRFVVRSVNPFSKVQLYGIRERSDDSNDDIHDGPSDYQELLPYEEIISGKNVFCKISEEGAASKAIEWQYVPFNFRQDELIRKLEGAVQNKFGKGIDQLEQLYLDSTRNQKKIRRIFNATIGDPNTNSMTLFSGPLRKCIANQKFERSSTSKCFKIWPPGCLYTGDYNAKGEQEWKVLKSRYENYWDQIGCVQIPHHGSQYSFNPEFVEMKSSFVISAGAHNKYHHPHKKVTDLFSNKKITPSIVTDAPERKLTCTTKIIPVEQCMGNIMAGMANQGIATKEES